MKFDFVIGNPPYQDETLGDNKGFAPPVYHKFLEAAYKIANTVEMIHPARFLFNAGSTPKQWNEQMLQDPHLKVLYFEQDSSKVFSENNERVYKYVRRDYINTVSNLDKYKIFLPKANGVGALGEILSMPILSDPMIGATETFLSIGAFEQKAEAEAALKYIKTKFARVLLGVLKTTQDITPEKWKCVPLQDFTHSSDIDWSTSIAEIDKQLYKKYNLSNEEIDFIETNVKEME